MVSKEEIVTIAKLGRVRKGRISKAQRLSYPAPTKCFLGLEGVSGVEGGAPLRHVMKSPDGKAFLKK